MEGFTPDGWYFCSQPTLSQAIERVGVNTCSRYRLIIDTNVAPYWEQGSDGWWTFYVKLAKRPWEV